MYTNQKNKESKLQKSKSNVLKASNSEFGQEKWIKEVVYPDFSDPTITFPCQSEIARFVHETPYSFKIPSTSEIVSAMPETVKDTNRINCVTKKVKDKESKLQKSQSNDWTSHINQIICGSIVCLPTPRFGVKTETTSPHLSPEAGLRMLPNLNDGRRHSFSGEFGQDKWIEEGPYPDLPLQSNSDLHDEPMVTFPSQNKVARFVQEMPDSSNIPSTSKVVPRKIVHAMSEGVKDKQHINGITQEVKDKEHELQRSQSNDWTPCINHTMFGSIACLPTQRFGIKTETTSHGQLSPKAGLRMLPDLTERPADCRGSFSGEFEQDKWIKEVPYPDFLLQSDSDLHDVLTVTFSDQNKITKFVQEMPDSSKLQKSQSFSGEFEQVKWIEETPYPIPRLQSDSDLHIESTGTFPSQSKIAPIHPRIAPFLFTNAEICSTNRKTQSLLSPKASIEEMFHAIQWKNDYHISANSFRP